MNVKIIKVLFILLASFAVLKWLRSDGYFDFDIRSIIPFMHGNDVGLHDWGGLVLIGLGIWGLTRLHESPDDESPSWGDEYEEEDDVDADV